MVSDVFRYPCAHLLYTQLACSAAAATTPAAAAGTPCPAAFRLRRIQSVTLKRFEPGCQLQHDTQLLYELWRTSPDGTQQQLLYVSEQVSNTHIPTLNTPVQQGCLDNPQALRPLHASMVQL
jgi:hypothetical protein